MITHDDETLGIGLMLLHLDLIDSLIDMRPMMWSKLADEVNYEEL